MELWQLVVFGIAGFVSSIYSGIAGGGGGFIMTPLGIFLGLTPAQSVATGKLSGLSVTLGSLAGLKNARRQVTWGRILPVMLLSLGVGLVVPHIISALANQAYQVALGVMLLLMIPLLYIKKVGLRPARPSTLKKTGGGVLLLLALLLQGAFSGGLGTLVNIVLMSMLGMTATEANITKRWSQLTLNVVIVLGLLGSGLIVWYVAAVGVASSFAGSYVGGLLAVKKGDGYIMNVTMILMAVSGIALILSA